MGAAVARSQRAATARRRPVGGKPRPKPAQPKGMWQTAGGPDPGEGPEPADAEPADGEHGAAPAPLVAATVCVEVANYSR